MTRRFHVPGLGRTHPRGLCLRNDRGEKQWSGPDAPVSGAISFLPPGCEQAPCAISLPRGGTWRRGQVSHRSRCRGSQVGVQANPSVTARGMATAGGLAWGCPTRAPEHESILASRQQAEVKHTPPPKAISFLASGFHYPHFD